MFIDSVLLNGAKLILDKVYDSIGFNKISDDILRHFVTVRLCQPMSKLATADYLKSHFDEDVKLNRIYRYMDQLYNTQHEEVQRHRRTVYLFCTWRSDRDAFL